MSYQNSSALGAKRVINSLLLQSEKAYNDMFKSAKQTRDQADDANEK